MSEKFVRGTPNISAKAWFALGEYARAPGQLLVGAAGEQDLDTWQHAFKSLAGLVPGLPPFVVCLWGADLSERARAMRALYSPEAGLNYVHIASPEALSEALMAETEYSDLRFSFKQGYDYERAAVLDRFLKAASGLKVPILLGVMPLHSLRHADFLQNELVGIIVPEEARERALAEKDRPKQPSPFATIFSTIGDLRANISELLADPKQSLDINNGSTVPIEEQVPPQKLPISN